MSPAITMTATKPQPLTSRRDMFLQGYPNTTLPAKSNVSLQNYPNEVGYAGTTSINLPGGAGHPETPIPGGLTGSSGGKDTSGINTQSDSVLPNFGYKGDIGTNPYERKALDFISELEETRAPLQSLSPAKDFYGDLLSGAYSPTGEKFRRDVYEATETEAMKRLADIQDMIGERFVNTGGFFGGRHAIAQGEAAADVASNLDKLLAEMNLSGFESDIANKMTGAQGITGLGTTERGIESSLLNDILTGGQYLTGKELTNRELYQQATDRAYQDWVRARQEKLLPFNMITSLLGMPTQQTVVEQPQPSPWSYLLQGVGQGVGQLPAYFI